MAESIPARYIKLRNNPATRVHVPTKYLTPDQQKQRARNTRIKTENNTLYNPMAPLSGQALRDTVNAMAAADIGPEIKAGKENVDFLKRYATATQNRMGELYQQLGK